MRTPNLLVQLLTLAWALLAGVGASDGVVDLPTAWAARRADAVACCVPLDADRAPSTPEQALLARTLGSLRDEERIGAPLVEHAERLGVGVCLDAYERACDGVYVCDQRVILLDADLADGLRTAILVHELRHVDQAAAGYRMNMDHDVYAARTLLCACEADAQAIATWFAWRARQAGDPRPWAALRAHPHYADIAGAFEAAVLLGADEPTAARAAFRRWYASDWRVETYRFQAAIAYFHRIDEEHLIARDEPVPEDYFSDFGVLPDGSSYGAAPQGVE